MDSNDLAPAATRYFDLMDGKPGISVTDVFAPDAEVRDDGHTYAGHDEIESWRTGPASEFTTTSTWLSASHNEHSSHATIRIAGNFPGSPVNLHYRFAHNENGLISNLSITT